MPIRDKEGFDNTRSFGSHEEDRAVRYLEQQGCRILERNYYTRSGEIDIIFSDTDGTICFGEVKYRENPDNGLPEEAVTYSKQKKICHVSDIYRAKKSLDESLSYRYDVIALTPENCKWIKNAFSYV